MSFKMQRELMYIFFLFLLYRSLALVAWCTSHMTSLKRWWRHASMCSALGMMNMTSCKECCGTWWRRREKSICEWCGASTLHTSVFSLVLITWGSELINMLKLMFCFFVSFVQSLMLMVTAKGRSRFPFHGLWWKVVGRSNSSQHWLYGCIFSFVVLLTSSWHYSLPGG